jgi:hypothetical protein
LAYINTEFLKNQLSAGFPVSYNNPNNEQLMVAKNLLHTFYRLYAATSGALSASTGTVVVECDPKILRPFFKYTLT